MRIASFPKERGEKNLCIGSLDSHLHDSVSSQNRIKNSIFLLQG